MGEIYKKILDAMSEIECIGKGRTNSQQGFKFRGIDDMYNELHSILAKHRIFTTSEVLTEKSEERQTKTGGNLIYRILKIKFSFHTDDGSFVTSEIIGEGMDSGDKASNKAMSVAHKYALIQIFCIPTEEEKDPDFKTQPPSKPSTTKEPIKSKLDPSLCVISDAQRIRLRTIAGNKKMPDEKVKMIIGLNGYESSKDIQVKDYDKIVKEIEDYAM
jgi:hypothetical protein